MRMLAEALPEFLRPLSVQARRCARHGVDYEERVFKFFTQGCPLCRQEAQQRSEMRRQAAQQQAEQQRQQARLLARLGAARIPRRFAEKSLQGFEAVLPSQRFVLQRVTAYAQEFKAGHSGRCLALLGNAGTGKTHLACALANFVMRECALQARFSSVAEIGRLVREAKSFSSECSESEVIAALAAFDLLVVDEVGVQSGSEAEARALFDVFNERYQNLKPTVLISNLDAAGFKAALGDRIADRLKEDGGEVLFFGWQSRRGGHED